MAAVIGTSGDVLSVTLHCSGGKQIMMCLHMNACSARLLLDACGTGVFFVFACMRTEKTLTCSCLHADMASHMLHAGN